MTLPIHLYALNTFLCVVLRSQRVIVMLTEIYLKTLDVQGPAGEVVAGCCLQETVGERYCFQLPLTLANLTISAILGTLNSNIF